MPDTTNTEVRSLTKDTFIPIGAVLSLCGFLFYAGGQFNSFSRRLDALEQSVKDGNENRVSYWALKAYAREMREKNPSLHLELPDVDQIRKDYR